MKLNAIERKNYSQFGNFEETRRRCSSWRCDQAGPRRDQEFDESLDSFVLITFNYNFSFAGFSQARRWARNIQPSRSVDGGYEPLPCILSKHSLCICAGSMLISVISVCYWSFVTMSRAPDPKSFTWRTTKSFRTSSGNFGCLFHSAWRHRWTSQESSPPSDSYGVVERIELLLTRSRVTSPKTCSLSVQLSVLWQ